MDNRPKFSRFFPEVIRDTIFVRAFGFWKVPLIAFVRPKVLEVDDVKVAIKIPLNRRTKNHLGSMYFGSLMIGADLAAAYYAVKLIFQSGKRIDFVFKNSQAVFLKRPTGDVVFSCTQGEAIRALVTRADESGERVDTELKVVCTVPSDGHAIVAEMNMVLSLKKRSKK